MDTLTETKTLALAAAGIPQTEVARTLGLGREQVGRLVRDPENAGLLTQLRASIRAKTLEAVERSQAARWDWVDQAVEAKDGRTFDQVTRGLLHLERIASSASGELQTRNVKIDGQIDATVQVEAKALILALLGEATEGQPSTISGTSNAT